MTLSINKILIISCVFILQGCGSTTMQRYSTTAPITLSDESQLNGAIFWDRQEGKNWYGAKIKNSPAVVSLQICNDKSIPKTFQTTTTEQSLIIPGRERDTLKFEISPQGQLQQVNQDTQHALNCAHLWQKGKPATPENLSQKSPLTLFVTCSSTNPNRYPKAGEYPFTKVAKHTVLDESEPFMCPN
jgi:hypothetical protein